jgi:flagellar biosynthetic protein FliR
MHETWNILAAGGATAIVLAMTRLGVLAMVCPPFAHPAVPVRVRLGAAAVLALGVTAAGAVPGRFIPAAQLPAALAGEALVGLAAGLCGRMVFDAAALAAEHAGRQMGLGLAAFYAGPAGAPGQPLATALRLMAVVVFLAIGGHRDLIAAVMDSFRVLPGGSAVLGGSLLATVTATLEISMMLALRVAGPVLAAMLLASVVLGVLQRSVPQMHVLSTNLPLRVAAGLVVLAASVAAMAAAVEVGWGQVLDRLLLWGRDAAGALP